MSFCCPTALANLLKGDCAPQLGGLLHEVYVSSLCNIASITSSTNDKEYDAIVMNVDPVTTNPYFWYRIQFKKNTAGLSSEAVIGTNKYFNQSISFQHGGIDKTSLEVLENMISADAVFIAKDYQGKIHLLGRVAGLKVESMTTGTGAAQDDLYGSEVTFSGSEREMHNLIASGTVIQVWDGSAAVNVTL